MDGTDLFITKQYMYNVERRQLAVKCWNFIIRKNYQQLIGHSSQQARQCVATDRGQ